MRKYEDPNTGALKYDLYFSDKQIKTGYMENGELQPFTHTSLRDKKSGEPLKMVRIYIRDASNRSYRFNNDKLNSAACWIQVPADAVKRKIKGITSVYEVTKPIIEDFRAIVYSGDINAKNGWRGPTEQVNFTQLCQILEFQEIAKEVVAKEEAVVSEPQTAPKEDPEVEEIDSIFPYQETENIQQEEHPEPAAVEKESKGQDSPEARIAALEAIVASQQATIEALSGQVKEMTESVKKIDSRTQGFANSIETISEQHRELIDIYSRIKDWSRSMLGKYNTLDFTVDSIKTEVGRMSDFLRGKTRAPKIEHRNR